MNDQPSQFVADGLQRFLRSPEFCKKRALIEGEVRREFADELAAATGYWHRTSIQGKIKREIDRRMKSITPSPYALWSSS